MTLVHIDLSKNALIKYEELWKKIKGLIRAINNNSEKQSLNIIVIVSSVSHGGSKYYSHNFLR